MIKKISLIINLILISIVSYSQTNPAETKLEKIYELIDKNKIDNAEKQLVELLEKYPSYGKGWDLLSKIKYYNYEKAKELPDLFGDGNISITTKDEDGNEIKNDSLSNSLANLFAQMNPSKKAYNDWILTLRKATLFSHTAYNCSISLRNIYHVDKVDTMVNDKALKYFNKAEEEFKAKNYNKAAEYYQRAIEYQPDFYKALLYLGDAYYFMENYVDAIKNFKICSEKYPTFLEPRKYLVDAYGHEGLYDNAIAEGIGALTVYPDLSIFAKMEDIIYYTGNKFSIEWQARKVLPNKIESDTNRLISAEESNLKSADKDSPWSWYLDAKSKIESFCDDRGLINQSTSLTSSRYMEMYSWEEMLNNSDSKELEQAKEMQKKGYLDCYIFITCFHEDIYDQYAHFVKNNPDKIVEYYKMMTVSR